MSAIFAERILRARAVKCRMRNWFEPSRFAAVEAHGKAANFAQGIHINVGLCPRSGQSSRELNRYRYGKCRRPRVRPEHFNRKGSQTLRRSVWKSRIRPRCSAPRSRQSLAEFAAKGGEISPNPFFSAACTMRPLTNTSFDSLPGASDLGASRRRPDFLRIEGRKLLSQSVRRFSAEGGSAPVRAVEVACQGQATSRSPDSFGASISIERAPTRSLTAWELRSGAFAAGRAPLCPAAS